MPTCPVHGSPMKMGKFGGYFCPRKMPDGTYCSAKASADTSFTPPATPAAPQASKDAPVASSDHLLVLGALDFAAKVYQGTSDAEGAKVLAGEIYSGWKGALS